MQCRRKLLTFSLFLVSILGLLAGTLPAYGEEKSGYVASQEGLRTFFDALSPFIGKPVIVSKSAARKQITGQFDFLDPLQVLDDISRQMGLVWYTDGKAIYIYNSAELQHSLFSLKNVSLTEFVAFLKKTGIYDKRFPIEGNEKGTFYVSGPPVYLELVLNAAGMMDRSSDGLEIGRQKIGIIHLTNTFVNDRTYELRGDKIVIPGLAKVVTRLLSNGDSTVQKVRTRQIMDLQNNQAEQASSLPTMPPFPESEAELGALKLEKNTSSDILSATEDIKVIAYPETNSLLVKGTTSQVDFVEKLIKALDVPKRHIELSLWIIDIEKNDLDRLGADFSGSLNIGSGFHLDFNSTGGVSTLDGNQFIAEIQALEQKKRATVVSRPVVLTQENVPAIFDNNRTFYARLIGERSTSLESVTYGTLISVLPRFGTQHQVELLLNIEDGNEAPSDDVEADELPKVGRTLISTVARVPRGKSLLVGGYTRDSQSTDTRKVPLLGDIPYLGRLFRYEGSTGSNVVRIFLIQPREVDERQMKDVETLLTDTRQLTQQIKTHREISDTLLNKWVSTYLTYSQGGR